MFEAGSSVSSPMAMCVADYPKAKHAHLLLGSTSPSTLSSDTRLTCEELDSYESGTIYGVRA